MLRAHDQRLTKAREACPRTSNTGRTVIRMRTLFYNRPPLPAVTHLGDSQGHSQKMHRVWQAFLPAVALLPEKITVATHRSS
jgi:hypothetical protein